MMFSPDTICIFVVSFQMALIFFLVPLFSTPLISSEIEIRHRTFWGFRV